MRHRIALLYISVLGACAGGQAVERARQERANQMIDCAARELDTGDIIKAMHFVLNARSMPVSSKDESIRRRIDALFAGIDSMSDDRIERWLKDQQFPAALELAEGLAGWAPDRQSRLDEVRVQAARFYIESARSAAEGGHLGSAALQLALARSAGAKETDSELARVWAEFRSRLGVAAPEVRVRRPEQPDGTPPAALSGGETSRDDFAAEEAHLAELVAGGTVTPAMENFFQHRYGRRTRSVLIPLLDALGHRKPSATPGGDLLFPGLGTAEAASRQTQDGESHSGDGKSHGEQ